MTLSPLCKALALYGVLEEVGMLDSGLPVRDLQRRWAATGLPADALHEVLDEAARSGEFEVVVDVRGARVRAAAFEAMRLNPCTLEEIDELVRAYALLQAAQLAAASAHAARPAADQP